MAVTVLTLLRIVFRQVYTISGEKKSSYHFRFGVATHPASSRMCLRLCVGPTLPGLCREIQKMSILWPPIQDPEHFASETVFGVPWNYPKNSDAVASPSYKRTHEQNYAQAVFSLFLLPVLRVNKVVYIN